MKIAVLGSAPSSLGKAPFADKSWEIWACSPGAYPRLARIDEFFEVHRWEPGVIGKPDTQRPWFTPEYVQWLKSVPPVVWVADPEAQKDIGFPRAKKLPWEQLVQKYGHYVWTSSVAYMLAMAIDKIMAARAERDEATRAAGQHIEPANGKAAEPERDVIGLWGVDMAANEELYTSQRAACQFFLQIVVGLGIEFYVPPESDLCTPPPMYGVSEISHKAIKLLERRRELEARLGQVNQQAESFRSQSFFLQGALDDLDYQQKMWMHQGEDTVGMDFQAVFPEIEKARLAKQIAQAAEAGQDTSHLPAEMQAVIRKHLPTAAPAKSKKAKPKKPKPVKTHRRARTASKRKRR